MNASVPGSGKIPPAPPPPFGAPPSKPDPVPSCGFIAKRVREMIDAKVAGVDLAYLESAEEILIGSQTDVEVMRGTLQALRAMLSDCDLTRREKNTLLLAIARIAGWLLLAGK